MFRRNRVIAIGRVLLLLAPWAFIAYLFRDVDAVLASFRGASVPPMVGALLVSLVALVSMALLWVRLVSYLSRGQGAPNAPHLLRSFARSWLARYLPGKVWAYGARALHTDADVVPRRIVGSSLVDEFVLILGSATVLGLGLWTWAVAGAVVGVPLLVGGLAVVAVAGSRLHQLKHLMLRLLGRVMPQRWMSVREGLERAADDPGLALMASVLFTAGYSLTNLASGLAFVLLVASLDGIESRDVLLLIGGYNVAAVVGVLAVFAPAGLGVREAILVGFLSSVVASPVAASIAVTLRVVTIIADILFVGLVEIASAFQRRGASGEGASATGARHRAGYRGPVD